MQQQQQWKLQNTACSISFMLVQYIQFGLGRKNQIRPSMCCFCKRRGVRTASSSNRMKQQQAAAVRLLNGKTLQATKGRRWPLAACLQAAYLLLGSMKKILGQKLLFFFANGNMAFSPPFLPVGLKIVDTSSQFECLQPQQLLTLAFLGLSLNALMSSCFF